MSRDVLLKLTSSAIEFADATTTQTSPMAMDGTAAASPARQLESDSAMAVADEACDADGRSSAVEDVLTAMALARRRQFVRAATTLTRSHRRSR
jgi:hypothetical protein